MVVDVLITTTNRIKVPESFDEGAIARRVDFQCEVNRGQLTIRAIRGRIVDETVSAQQLLQYVLEDSIHKMEIASTLADNRSRLIEKTVKNTAKLSTVPAAQTAIVAPHVDVSLDTTSEAETKPVGCTQAAPHGPRSTTLRNVL